MEGDSIYCLTTIFMIARLYLETYSTMKTCHPPPTNTHNKNTIFHAFKIEDCTDWPLLTKDLGLGTHVNCS